MRNPIRTLSAFFVTKFSMSSTKSLFTPASKHVSPNNLKFFRVMNLVRCVCTLAMSSALSDMMTFYYQRSISFFIFLMIGYIFCSSGLDSSFGLCVRLMMRWWFVCKQEKTQEKKDVSNKVSYVCVYIIILHKCK